MGDIVATILEALGPVAGVVAVVGVALVYMAMRREGKNNVHNPSSHDLLKSISESLNRIEGNTNKLPVIQQQVENIWRRGS